MSSAEEIFKWLAERARGHPGLRAGQLLEILLGCGDCSRTLNHSQEIGCLFHIEDSALLEKMQNRGLR